MRVLAIVPSQCGTSPGQRFRIEQWAPHLSARGIDISFEPFEDDRLHALLYAPGRTASKSTAIAAAFNRRLALMRRIADFDAVYLFREAAVMGPPLLERWMQRKNVPIVFDFDDAIFESYISPSNGRLSLLKCAGKTSTICRLASHVMAGNPYLAEYAGRFNSRVTVVPTTIDTDVYRPMPKTTSARCVIGWTGSHSTVQHLRTIEPALRRLASTHDFTLRVIGASDYSLGGVRVEAMPWRAASEVDDLRPIDIGIMPLPDDRWSRGKCGLKALQYMALGTPAVCSPVGVNAQIIRDGENGRLASTEDEWTAQLQELIESPGLRTRLGLEARRTVCERYSASAQIPVVDAVFRNCVA
jgi:glycosyltransferase involved in cell wall biosynthesis